MDGALWGDVAKGQTVGVFVDHIGGDFFADDFVEQCESSSIRCSTAVGGYVKLI